MSTSLTETMPTSAMDISRRRISPISRFNRSRTRWRRREAMTHLRWAWSEGGGDLFHGVTLDGIAGLEFVEAVDADAAFHAGADFVDFVLEAAQGLDDAFVNEVLPA